MASYASISPFAYDNVFNGVSNSGAVMKTLNPQRTVPSSAHDYRQSPYITLLGLHDMVLNFQSMHPDLTTIGRCDPSENDECVNLLHHYWAAMTILWDRIGATETVRYSHDEILHMAGNRRDFFVRGPYSLNPIWELNNYKLQYIPGVHFAMTDLEGKCEFGFRVAPREVEEALIRIPDSLIPPVHCIRSLSQGGIHLDEARWLSGFVKRVSDHDNVYEITCQQVSSPFEVFFYTGAGFLLQELFQHNKAASLSKFCLSVLSIRDNIFQTLQNEFSIVGSLSDWKRNRIIGFFGSKIPNKDFVLRILRGDSDVCDKHICVGRTSSPVDDMNTLNTLYVSQRDFLGTTLRVYYRQVENSEPHKFETPFESCVYVLYRTQGNLATPADKFLKIAVPILETREVYQELLAEVAIGDGINATTGNVVCLRDNGPFGEVSADGDHLNLCAQLLNVLNAIDMII